MSHGTARGASAPAAADPAGAATEFCPTQDPPGGKMLLEASAGTGKTHAITSRVLWLVAVDGVPLPRLLVVTFTRAAASELRERVRTRLAVGARALAAAARGDPPADPHGGGDDVVEAIVHAAAGDRTRLAESARALRRAGEELDEATISTIHGFCQRVLTASALETAIDFEAELVEDETPLRGEVVDDLAARWLRSADPEWIAYLRESAGVRHEVLDRVVERASGGERPALLPPPGGLDAAAETARWHEACTRFRGVWDEHRDALEADLTALKAEKRITGWNQKAKVRDTIARVDAWLASGPPLPTERDWPKDAGLTWLAERPKPPRERGLHPVIDAAIDVTDAALLPASHWLSAFAAAAPVELDARKHRQRTIAFDDQLRRLADALGDPSRRKAVADAVRQRYDVALIDEFQDTDPLQWAIFSEAFADAGLVLIGDPKQAIYAFRGADLPTYFRAAEAIPATAHRGLAVNWRSDQRYLDAINAMFARAGAFADPRIVPREIRAAAGLRDDRLAWPDGRARPALRIRYVGAAAAGLGEDRDRDGHLRRITKGWAHSHLPADVATEVRRLLDESPTLPDGEGRRPLEPSDIAVLVRTNRHARLVQAGLRKAGLPATIARAGSVLASTEADELVRLLDAVAEPTREPLARAAAATRLFGWSASDVVDPAREADWQAWAERRQRWHRLWHEAGVAPMLRAVFREEGVWPRLLTTEGGERAVANLAHLAERLHTAEREARLGPAALVSWLRTARAEARALEHRQAPEDAELRLERDDAAVQVVTVHASKGLQYPVVLCPFLWDPVGVTPPATEPLLFHDEDAGERRALDLHRGAELPGRRRSVEMATRQRHAESLRLTYVALTRAEHHAVVWWGRFNEAAESPLAWLWHRPGALDDADPGSSGDASADGERLAGVRAALTDDDAEIVATLRRFADRAGGAPAPAIAVEEVDEAPAPPPPAPPRAEEHTGDLKARAFDRALDRAWRRTSFTQLTRQAHAGVPPTGELGREDDEASHRAGGRPPPHAAADEPTDGGVSGRDSGDAPADAPSAELPLADAPPAELPLADAPRGPEFGDAVHRILEHTDFRADRDASGGLAQAVEREVARSVVLEERHRDALVGGLARTLSTPLRGGLGDIALADIDRRDRLDELEFELALAGGHTPEGEITLGLIADCLHSHRDGREAARSVAALGPGRPVRGFLTGSVDLVARLRLGDRPRYLVVDYKTNWLGEPADRDRDPAAEDRSSARHYRGPALEEAMHAHGYHLQAVLYLVAIHRYLRSRLGSSYSPEHDLAGAAYLFVRGMHGPAAQHGDAPSDGVWLWQPSAALVDDVDTLLATGRAAR